MDIRPWKNYSATFRQVMVAWMLFMAISGWRLCDCKCAFEAIFNFGDSNSDTGGFYAAFPAESLPYGMTYFRKPVGRATDGRLMIDFLGTVIFWFHSLFLVNSITFFLWANHAILHTVLVYQLAGPVNFCLSTSLVLLFSVETNREIVAPCLSTNTNPHISSQAFLHFLCNQTVYLSN